MRGRILFLVGVIAFITLSCDDPTALSVSKTFANSNLITAASDTFSVITSTVQLDTILTSNSGTLLLGEYKDPVLGSVTSSPYFVMGYNGSFVPGVTDVYDSIGLILPYNNKQFYGDTTQTTEFSVHQLTEMLASRSNPPTRDIKLSIFNFYTGFYSSSNSPYNPTPITTQTVKFRPHKDSLYIKLPYSLGANWFRLAKLDSGHLFTNQSNFITNFFRGLHLKVNPSGGGSMAAFNPSKVKIRLYYEKNVYDIRKQVHFDFTLQNTGFQFQNILADRSGSPVSGIKAREAIPSSVTNNETFVQAGTGLVTRLDFPSLKNFFKNKHYIFNGAFLQVFPVRKSFDRSLSPPSQLFLYTTDDSNVPTGNISGGVGSIRYDYEYNINTLYTFTLFNYVYSEISSSAIAPTPLLIAPSQSSLGNNVQRVIIGDRFHPTSKIKLIVYYSYAPN
jgi:hypothetical protein